CQQGTTLPFTF
nr:immunoglobulin light chain junction region [Mus musculus]